MMHLFYPLIISVTFAIFVTNKVVAVESTPVSNREAIAEITVNATPDQTKFSVPTAIVNLDPNLLSQGQHINISIPITNTSSKSTLNTSSSYAIAGGSWLKVTSIKESNAQNLAPGAKGVIEYSLQVEKIPANAQPLTITITVKGSKPQPSGTAHIQL